MANFTINIDYPPISYSNKSSYTIFERCNSSYVVDEAIQLLNSTNTIYSFLSAYTGDLKANLVITSIASNGLDLKYNNIVKNNVDLPLTIDISSLNDTDLIPLLKIGGTIPVSKIVSENVINNVIIHFYIEDENGQKGDTLSTTFQVMSEPCSSLSSITSTLPIVSDGNGLVNYQLTANNQYTSFSVSGLPTGITYNETTGLISGTSTLVGIHPISMVVYNEKGSNSYTSTIEIINPAIILPVITSPLTMLIDTEFIVSYKIEATNDPISYSYTIPDPLKYILLVDYSDNSIIKGKSTLVENGVYNITISATNGSGTVTETLVLTVNIPADDYIDGWDFIDDERYDDRRIE